MTDRTGKEEIHATEYLAYLESLQREHCGLPPKIPSESKYGSSIKGFEVAAGSVAIPRPSIVFSPDSI